MNRYLRGRTGAFAGNGQDSRRGRRSYKVRNAGFTMIELLVALAIGAIVLAGLSGVVGNGLQAYTVARETNNLSQQARFAMAQIASAVQDTSRLLLPLNDNPNTGWPEHIRVQTVPPSAPIGTSTFATAVLAVTLDRLRDLDGNGIPDADRDGDGRFDEDLASDNTLDGASGIINIDDDGDGQIDEGGFADNDEDGTSVEDMQNGIDDDGDGSIDEDITADMNFDGQPGIANVDDDEDGQVDEGSAASRSNDDEDILTDEDGYDPVVFYLRNSSLIQRIPVPWDVSGDGIITGLDFLEEPIAENVTRFRVERLLRGSERYELVDITLELTSPVTGETVSLNSRIRVGGAL